MGRFAKEAARMYRSISASCIVLLACGSSNPVTPLAIPNVTFTTPEDTPLVFTVMVAAKQPDAVTFSVVTPPAHGTLAGQGPQFTYSPAPEYNGPDTVVLRGQDTTGT